MLIIFGWATLAKQHWGARTQRSPSATDLPAGWKGSLDKMSKPFVIIQKQS